MHWAHDLKPLAIPDGGLRLTAIFNGSCSFADDISIIKLPKLTCAKKKRRNYKEMVSADYRLSTHVRDHPEATPLPLAHLETRRDDALIYDD